VSVINVGLRIGPLSVKSKDPGSFGKDSLFYWKKLRVSPATENILSTGTEDALCVRKKLAKALNFGYTS